MRPSFIRPIAFAKPLSRAKRSLLSIFCCFVIITVLWLGVRLDNSSMGLAELSELRIAETLNGAIASQPMILENLKDQVKDDLSEKINSVTDNPVANPTTEKSRSVVRQPKRSFDNSVKQVESKVDGRTEENVAKIQGKVTNSRRKVENAVEDVMSNIKNKSINAFFILP